MEYTLRMTETLPRPGGSLLAELPGDPYYVPDVLNATGDQVPGESSSILEVADALRRELHSGTWRAGERFRTREQIADDHAVSAESAGVALRMLRDEGLVTLEQGRGTFVAPLRYYSVTVTAELPEDAESPPWQYLATEASMLADPSLVSLTFDHEGSGRFWKWQAQVHAADAARAGTAALAAARRSAMGVAWDYSGAAISTTPL